MEVDLTELCNLTVSKGGFKAVYLLVGTQLRNSKEGTGDTHMCSQEQESKWAGERRTPLCATFGCIPCVCPFDHLELSSYSTAHQTLVSIFRNRALYYSTHPVYSYSGLAEVRLQGKGLYIKLTFRTKTKEEGCCSGYQRV